MIRTEVSGAVGRIVLDRPEKRNALTPAMLAAIPAAVAELEKTCGAIVLRGEGEAFCAGFDLSMCREDAEVLGELLTGLSRVVRALRRCEAPVVAAAHGAAIAGGCAMLGGCDVVVTDAAAKLGYPVVRLGISPAVSGPTLRLLTGDGAARERMLDSGLIDGRRAIAIGLAHECAEAAAAAIERAEAIAAELAAKPRDGIVATKRWLNELDGTDRDDLLDRALNVSLSLVGSDEERTRLAQLWAKQERTR